MFDALGYPRCEKHETGSSGTIRELRCVKLSSRALLQPFPPSAEQKFQTVPQHRLITSCHILNQRPHRCCQSNREFKRRLILLYDV